MRAARNSVPMIRRLRLDFKASDNVLLACALHNQSPMDERVRYHLKLLAGADSLEEVAAMAASFA